MLASMVKPSDWKGGVSVLSGVVAGLAAHEFSHALPFWLRLAVVGLIGGAVTVAVLRALKRSAS